MFRMLLVITIGVMIAGRGARGGDEVEELVDELVQVDEYWIEPGDRVSNTRFLPYGDSELFGMDAWDLRGLPQCETLQKIVAKGVKAVPTLLKHLSDDREIRAKPIVDDSMRFVNRYDFNRRIWREVPEGVNLSGGNLNPDELGAHSITVGDMCFVALGQIVNRDFHAAFMAASGTTHSLHISSPTYSERLREVVTEEWKELTAEKHKESLIEDFRRPDNLERLIGAYLRLSFYYPEAVEELVVEKLEQPIIDEGKVEIFCRDMLYKAVRPESRPELFDQFVLENGDHYAEGVVDQLFKDLSSIEDHHEDRADWALR